MREIFHFCRVMKRDNGEKIKVESFIIRTYLILLE
jgi:hypothetical protein